MEYETDEVQLAPGERVFFFTDGADPGYDEGFSEQLLRHADLELELQVGGALGEVIELDAAPEPRARGQPGGSLPFCGLGPCL